MERVRTEIMEAETIMTELLDLLKDGRARSVEELALSLKTNVEDVRRRMEYLEHAGYLRRVGSCGHSCSGCSSHCGGGLTAGLPVMWEIKRESV